MWEAWKDILPFPLDAKSVQIVAELNLWLKPLEHKRKVLCLLSISSLPILRTRSPSLAFPQPFGSLPITAHSAVL